MSETSHTQHLRDHVLLTAAEVADILKVSIHTVRHWRDTGYIPYVKVGNMVRFRAVDVEALITNGTRRKAIKAADKARV